MSCVRGHKREDWHEGYGTTVNPDDKRHAHCQRCAEDRALIERTVRIMERKIKNYYSSPERLERIIEEVLRGGQQ